MTPEDLHKRQQAYQRILTLGLLGIRDRGANHGNSKLCEIEADHLHNIPSLLDEPNEHRHIHYASCERDFYLKRIKECADQNYMDFVVKLYEEPWTVLLGFALLAQERINKGLEQDAPPDSSHVL